MYLNGAMLPCSPIKQWLTLTWDVFKLNMLM